ADISYVHEEAAAHRLGHRELDLLLGLPGLGPIALHQLVPLLDFNKRPPGLITRSPPRHELLPWLHLPIRRRQQLRYLNGQVRRLRLQHLQREPAGDFLAEPILRLEHRAVSSRRQLERELPTSIRVGGEAFLRNYLVQGPVVWRGEVWEQVGHVRLV